MAFRALKRLERAGLVRPIDRKPLVFYQAPVGDARLAPRESLHGARVEVLR